MIIDFGATPPIESLSLGDGSHLANYRRVYASSEKDAARGQTTTRTIAYSRWTP